MHAYVVYVCIYTQKEKERDVIFKFSDLKYFSRMSSFGGGGMETCVVIVCVCVCVCSLSAWLSYVCMCVLSLCVVIGALKHARCQIHSRYARLVNYLRYHSPQVCVQDALDSP
jgi:hypothetical protein